MLKVKSTCSYKNLTESGSGAYGSIYRGLDIDTSSEIAVKKLNTPFQSDLADIIVIRTVDHQNIVHILDIMNNDECFTKTEYGYVMPFLGYDTLMKYIKSAYTMKEEQLLNIIKDLSCAVDYLHNAGIYHMDIKPDNILVENMSSSQPLATLVDFGLGLFRPAYLTADVYSTRLRITSNYRPPEIKPNSTIYKYNGKSDVFALGMTFINIICKEVISPLPMDYVEDAYGQGFVLYKYNDTRWMDRIDAIAPSLTPLLANMINPNEQERYSMKDVLLYLHDNNILTLDEYTANQGHLVVPRLSPCGNPIKFFDVLKSIPSNLSICALIHMISLFYILSPYLQLSTDGMLRIKDISVKTDEFTASITMLSRLMSSEISFEDQAITDMDMTLIRIFNGNLFRPNWCHYCSTIGQLLYNYHRFTRDCDTFTRHYSYVPTDADVQELYSVIRPEYQAFLDGPISPTVTYSDIYPFLSIRF